MTTVSEEARPASGGLAAWKRRMWITCLVLMPVGLLLLLLGAATAWGSNPLAGFSVGCLGVLLLVGGALCAKFAVAGPYPRGLQ